MSEHSHAPGVFAPRCPACIDEAAGEAERRGHGVEAWLTAAGFDPSAVVVEPGVYGVPVTTRSSYGSGVFAGWAFDPAPGEVVLPVPWVDHPVPEGERSCAECGRPFVTGDALQVTSPGGRPRHTDCSDPQLARDEGV